MLSIIINGDYYVARKSNGKISNIIIEKLEHKNMTAKEVAEIYLANQNSKSEIVNIS